MVVLCVVLCADSVLFGVPADELAALWSGVVLGVAAAELLADWSGVVAAAPGVVLVPAALAVLLGAAAGAPVCGEALLVVVVLVVLWLDCAELGCEAFEAAPAASGEAGVLGDALEAVEVELFMPLMPLFEAAPGLLEAPLFEQLEAIMFTLFT